MAANKTTETDASVTTFLATVADAGQRADAETLIDLLARLTDAPPKMWGPSIIGFGRYRYRYESGREGEMCRIGFSPRRGKTALYAKGGHPNHLEILARLGKVKPDKGCIHIKRLADVSMDALEQLCAASLVYMAEQYPVED